ncbi:MAG TPA: lysine transporter LysE [Bacteroidetes bacterium]|nr:lysine transporter LysE [Bacteroidota bacterium]
MLYVFGKGLLIGVGMSLMLGTVFFSLIQTSIMKGWNKGALIAVGVVFSDLIFISLALFGVQFLKEGERNVWIYSAAVILLTVMAINMLRDRKSKVLYPESRMGKAVFYIVNGFLLNIANPANFIAWAGLAAFARSDWGYETEHLLYFFAGCLMSIFGTEVLISILAHKIKGYLNVKILLWINRVTAIVFLGVAVYLVVDFILNYSW